jgi:hypothetical protein
MERPAQRILMSNATRVKKTSAHLWHAAQENFSPAAAILSTGIRVQALN